MGRNSAFINLNCCVLVVCLSVNFDICSWKLFFFFFAITIPLCRSISVCVHFGNKYRHRKHWCLEKVPSWLSVKESYTVWLQTSGQLGSLHFLLRTQSCLPIFKFFFSAQVKFFTVPWRSSDWILNVVVLGITWGIQGRDTCFPQYFLSSE